MPGRGVTPRTGLKGQPRDKGSGGRSRDRGHGFTPGEPQGQAGSLPGQGVRGGGGGPRVAHSCSIWATGHLYWAVLKRQMSANCRTVGTALRHPLAPCLPPISPPRLPDPPHPLASPPPPPAMSPLNPKCAPHTGHFDPLDALAGVVGDVDVDVQGLPVIVELGGALAQCCAPLPAPQHPTPLPRDPPRSLPHCWEPQAPSPPSPAPHLGPPNLPRPLPHHPLLHA